MTKYLCEANDQDVVAIVAHAEAAGSTVVEIDGSKYIQIEAPTRKDKIV